jgi:hypothetical protein
MVTSLRSGRTGYGSPNWTTVFCLVQRVHSGFRAMLCSGSIGCYFCGQNVLEAEGKRKTQSSAIVENEWSCASTP